MNRLFRLKVWRGIPFFFSGLLVLIVLKSSAGAATDLGRVLLELENREKTMTSLSFDFSQEVEFTQMNNKSFLSGHALFGKGGKLRISKVTPEKQVTISDGKKVWVYNPSAKQVWEGGAKKWMESSQLPKGLLTFNNYVADLKKNFDLKLVDEAAGEPHQVGIDATPKNKNLGYTMRLIISTDLWLPIKTLYLSETAHVETRLSQHQINPKVAVSDFKFSAPAGVDIIPFN
ncbi:MAG: Outer-membrane lipoprotein carrier protein [Elusimicrobia bacterium]|nr:Outer-membrane lipoprotein carrier protein [Elusimicrobiota bacterium]